MPRLPVANASIRSPLYCSPVPPTLATPRAARCASRVHWCGSSGASVAMTTMIEPEPGSYRAGVCGSGTSVRPDQVADGNAVDPQQLAATMVGLHQYPDGVLARPRCR